MRIAETQEYAERGAAHKIGGRHQSTEVALRQTVIAHAHEELRCGEPARIVLACERKERCRGSRDIVGRGSRCSEPWNTCERLAINALAAGEQPHKIGLKDVAYRHITDLGKRLSCNATGEGRRRIDAAFSLSYVQQRALLHC